MKVPVFITGTFKLLSVMKKKPVIKKQPVEVIQPKLSTLNINKFSFWQLFNDSKGKTSAPNTAGLLIVLCACGGFAASIAMKYNDGITGSFIFVGAGAALLGGKMISKDKEIAPEVSGNVVNPVVTAKDTSGGD